MKKLFACIVSVLTLICLCGCTQSLTPVDYGFEFEFLAVAENLDFTNYNRTRDCGGIGYYNPKYAVTDYDGNTKLGGFYVLYTASGAPDVLDEWYITEITCTDPEIEFFDGLTLADDSEIEAYLEGNGFKVKMFDSIPTHFKATKGRTIVEYYKDTKIDIKYIATNKKNLDF